MVTDSIKRERLERLADLRRKKESEINELEEKKKKELEELQEKNKKELQEAEERLQSEMVELTAQEEEEILQVLRKELDSIKEEEINLEETVIQEKISAEAYEQSANQTSYTAPIEEILSSPDAIYQRGDLYQNLRETLTRVENGQYLSQQEMNKFEKVRQEFSSVHQPKEDSFGYVNRSKQILNAVEDKLSQSLYKRGDDH